MLLDGINFGEADALLDGVSSFQSFKEEYLDNAPTSSVTIDALDLEYKKFQSGENPNTTEIVAGLATLNNLVSCDSSNITFVLHVTECPTGADCKVLGDTTVFTPPTCAD